MAVACHVTTNQRRHRCPFVAASQRKQNDAVIDFLDSFSFFNGFCLFLSLSLSSRLLFLLLFYLVGLWLVFFSLVFFVCFFLEFLAAIAAGGQLRATDRPTVGLRCLIAVCRRQLSPSGTWFQRRFLTSYRFLPNFTEFYRLSPHLISFFIVLTSLTYFYLVLRSLA